MSQVRRVLRVLPLVLLTVAVAVPAAAGDRKPAALLSAALGGSLGDGMCDAGQPGHGKLTDAVEVRESRSDVYRRQVARAGHVQERTARFSGVTH
jgi:hypothetical protein